MSTIVHTTDLVHDDRAALAHAVALARFSGAKLVSLHANDEPDSIERMPKAEALLSSWGLDPASVSHERKVHGCCEDPLETILDGLRTMAPTLVVVGSHQKSALSRFFAGSGSETIARNIRTPVLLLPPEARGFVGPEDGKLELTRVLIPIGDVEAAARAIEVTRSFVERFTGPQDAVEFTLLHVGPKSPPPVDLDGLRARPGWSVQQDQVEVGVLEDQIVRRAAQSCLVVMATRGHDSVTDVVRGSHTDRVLRRTSCPLLSVLV